MRRRPEPRNPTRTLQQLADALGVTKQYVSELTSGRGIGSLDDDKRMTFSHEDQMFLVGILESQHKRHLSEKLLPVGAK